MAGHWPIVLLGVYGPVHKHEKEKRAWSIKNILYGIKRQNMINFPCGTKPVSRAGKIASSCPLG